MQYLGIADHSRSAAYAGGLSIERVHDQWAGDRCTQQDVRRQVSPIQRDRVRHFGRWLARLSRRLLEGFDYVVASVHSHFNLPREEMTKRLVRAASNPRVTMLGHPTGGYCWPATAMPSTWTR